MHTIIAYFFVGQQSERASSKLSSLDVDTNTSVLLCKMVGFTQKKRTTKIYSWEKIKKSGINTQLQGNKNNNYGMKVEFAACVMS